MSDSNSYYAQNAQQFFMNTVHVDTSELYEGFLAAIPAGGLILDAGCGSGRDTKEFIDRGYRVVAFDSSPELAALASHHTEQPIGVRNFSEVNEQSSMTAFGPARAFFMFLNLNSRRLLRDCGRR